MSGFRGLYILIFRFKKMEIVFFFLFPALKLLLDGQMVNLCLNRRIASSGFICLLTCFLVWWSTIHPSNSQPLLYYWVGGAWRPSRAPEIMRQVALCWRSQGTNTHSHTHRQGKQGLAGQLDVKCPSEFRPALLPDAECSDPFWRSAAACTVHQLGGPRVPAAAAEPTDAQLLRVPGGENAAVSSYQPWDARLH